jgi:hypothetical protein
MGQQSPWVASAWKTERVKRTAPRLDLGEQNVRMHRLRAKIRNLRLLLIKF